MTTVQKTKPTRTCTKSYSNYPSFKQYLKNDYFEKYTPLSQL
jgi:hypothetical protein